MKDLKITKALKFQSATLRGDLDIVMFRQLPDNFANHLLDRLSHRLLDNTPRYGYHELKRTKRKLNESRAIPTDN